MSRRIFAIGAYSVPATAVIHINTTANFNFTVYPADVSDLIAAGYLISAVMYTDANWTMTGNDDPNNAKVNIQINGDPSHNVVSIPLPAGNYSVSSALSSGQFLYITNNIVPSGTTYSVSVYFNSGPPFIDPDDNRISSFSLTLTGYVDYIIPAPGNRRIFTSKIIVPSIRIKSG